MTELKRTIANMEVMELEFKFLQETIKYKEEDKRVSVSLLLPSSSRIAIPLNLIPHLSNRSGIR